MSNISIKSDISDVRLDKFLSLTLKNFSRSKIQTLIKDNAVIVNNKPSKSSYIISKGDKIAVNDQIEVRKIPKDKKSLIDLKILHENKEFMVIDKPPNLIVHPSSTSFKNFTLVDFVINKIGKNFNDNLRPGIVHRLDKDTSGVLIVAKTKKASLYFIDQFKKHKIEKVYLALVKGILEYKKGIIDSPIARNFLNRKKMSISDENSGKSSVTSYKVLKEFFLDNKTGFSLLKIKIQTGRTHQIRVHMAAIDHPVVGDKVYGIKSINNRFFEKFGLNRQFLHAYSIKFKDPTTKKDFKVISNLPEDLNKVIFSLS